MYTSVGCYFYTNMSDMNVYWYSCDRWNLVLSAESNLILNNVNELQLDNVTQFYQILYHSKAQVCLDVKHFTFMLKEFISNVLNRLIVGLSAEL